MSQRSVYFELFNQFRDARQMLFVAGPRQAGKTTFARELMKTYADAYYVNWDIVADRTRLLKNPHFYREMDRTSKERPLVVLDEIHKKQKWKNFLKGLYDADSLDFKLLVTGSGRLDLFQKGQDSLAGRYFLLHFWPFSLGELAKGEKTITPADAFKGVLEIPKASTQEEEQIWENLMRFSGFPDPYSNSTESFFNAWTQTYERQVISEDIRNFAQIQKLQQFEDLFYLARQGIGSPLSLQNLSENTDVAYDTAKKWCQILDQFFLTFSLSTWSKKVSRTIKKEKKIYTFNAAALADASVKFENMVALELKAAVSRWNDSGSGRCQLFYLRNKEKQEIDFLIVSQNAPAFMVECKLADTNLAPAITKFQNALRIPAVQLVSTPGICRLTQSSDHGSTLICTASRWLAQL